MLTFIIDMHVILFSVWREYLVKDREGIAIIGENAEYLNGTYHIQIQENTERTMSLRVENHTPVVVQLLHCEMLKRMRVFKLDDTKKMTEGRQAVSINSGKFLELHVNLDLIISYWILYYLMELTLDLTLTFTLETYNYIVLN